MLTVGSKLLRPHYDERLKGCPFCGSWLVEYETCKGTSFHPDNGCILSRFGVDKKLKSNRVVSQFEKETNHESEG